MAIDSNSVEASLGLNFDELEAQVQDLEQQIEKPLATKIAGIKLAIENAKTEAALIEQQTSRLGTKLGKRFTKIAFNEIGGDLLSQIVPGGEQGGLGSFLKRTGENVVTGLVFGGTAGIPVAIVASLVGETFRQFKELKARVQAEHEAMQESHRRLVEYQEEVRLKLQEMEVRAVEREQELAEITKKKTADLQYRTFLHMR